MFLQISIYFLPLSTVSTEQSPEEPYYLRCVLICGIYATVFQLQIEFLYKYLHG